MSTEVTGDVGAYSQHWDRWFEGDKAHNKEWHTTWSALRPIISPYLLHAAAHVESPSKDLTHQTQHSDTEAQAAGHTAVEVRGGATLLDVGCGRSSLAEEIVAAGIGYASILLLDASPRALQAAQTASSTAAHPNCPPHGSLQRLPASHIPHRDLADVTQHAPQLLPQPNRQLHTETLDLSESADAEQTSKCVLSSTNDALHRLPLCRDMLLSDCRHLPLRSASIQAVLDKGTMDALWNDDDKVRMLEACASVLARPHGVLVSVSFASPARLRLLTCHLRRLRLEMRVHVIGAGDPARGHEVRFVTLLSEAWPRAVPYRPTQLTRTLLLRLLRTGSLLEPMPPEAERAALDETYVSSLDSHAFFQLLCEPLSDGCAVGQR